ncbi:amidase [Sphingorhabdus soli]|uniref:Amidase n=1 Tax=Flavisphingopyxis soli TaxID=2601267 RepID=A0A5C6UNG5_9SPHN|nr:amidase [Sphingorhabdus soli]TXC73651.1 amidase [Sphingorhabdus soli]
MIRSILTVTTAMLLVGCASAPISVATADAPPPVAAAAASTGAVETPGIEVLSIAELSAAMARGDTTSEAITAGYLARIAAIDDAGPTLNAVIATMPDALDQARARDAERAAGQVRGPLHGIPILIKDNIEAAGPLPTTAGSIALADNVTNRDAPMIARLKAAGAIILGKTNLSEWANIRSGNSTSGWSAVGGLTKNPHVLDRNTCGSSAGSGAAMAAGLAAGTIGTETDGSITCPSGVNGVVGFKPTVGLVSRTYIVPISHSQDTAGPMTGSVRDAAMMLTAMAGSDPADPATAEADLHKTDFAAALDPDWLAGKRIGVLIDQIGDDPSIHSILDEALATLRAKGAEIVEISDSNAGMDTLGDDELEILMVELKADLDAYLASTPAAVKTRTLADLIAFNEAHADTEMRYFGQELFTLAQGKPGLDDAGYIKTRDAARTLAGPDGIDRLMRTYKVDVLMGVTNGPAWLSTLGKGDAYSGPSVSQLPAVAGYPHLTVPGGTIGDLPVGISFIGGKWQDAKVLSAGYAFEQARPRIVTPSFIATTGESPEATAQ